MRIPAMTRRKVVTRVLRITLTMKTKTREKPLRKENNPKAQATAMVRIEARAPRTRVLMETRGKMMTRVVRKALRMRAMTRVMMRILKTRKKPLRRENKSHRGSLRETLDVRH